MKKYLNIAFYKFVELDNLPERRQAMRARCRELGFRGTILLSAEGINGFLAGEEEVLRQFLSELAAKPEFFKLEVKESWSSQIPFSRMLVKLKKEIISMGRPDIRPTEMTGKRLLPSDFKKWLDENRDIVVLDTRNDYEVEAGTFEKAEHLNLKNFREFGERLKEVPKEKREKPVVMFCTGGIRCEKATALALKEGFTDVYQLEGGILKYFEEIGGAHYKGDCFVFDNRVTVDPELRETGKGYENGRMRWSNQPM
jgi:predicted sulfurtransferase